MWSQSTARGARGRRGVRVQWHVKESEYKHVPGPATTPLLSMGALPALGPPGKPRPVTILSCSAQVSPPPCVCSFVRLSVRLFVSTRLSGPGTRRASTKTCRSKNLTPVRENYQTAIRRSNSVNCKDNGKSGTSFCTKLFLNWEFDQSGSAYYTKHTLLNCMTTCDRGCFVLTAKLSMKWEMYQCS